MWKLPLTKLFAAGSTRSAKTADLPFSDNVFLRQSVMIGLCVRLLVPPNSTPFFYPFGARRL
jgi:hypothetical protein